MVFFMGKNGYTCTRPDPQDIYPYLSLRVDPHTSSVYASECCSVLMHCA